MMPSRETLIRAAELLEYHAESLKLGHTIKGEWPNEDAIVEADCAEMLAIAAELRRAAG